MSIDCSPLSMDNIARSAAESVAPELWPAHAWVPSLGYQGGKLMDVCEKSNTSLISTVTWDTNAIKLNLLNNDNNYINIPDNAALPEVTISINAQFYNGSALPFLFSASNGDGRIQFNSGTNRIDYSGFGANPNTTVSWLVPGNTYTFTLTGKQNILKLFVNNKFCSSTSSGTNATSWFGNGLLGMLRTTYNGYNYIGKISSILLYKKYLSNGECASIGLDPLLPFRRRKRTFYTLPRQQRTETRYAVKHSVDTKDAPLTMDTIARSASESVAPELWPSHAWVPSLGYQGGRLVDVCGKLNGVVGSSNSWGKGGLTVTGETCYITRDASIEPQGIFTVVACAKIPQSPTDGAILYGKQNTAWDGFYQSYAARAYTTGGSFIRFGLGTSSSYYGLNVAATYGKISTIVQRYNGSKHDAFVDNNYNSVNATGTIQYADVPLYIGDGVSFGATWSDVIYSVCLYDKWLNNSQVSQLSADPLLPFRRRKRTFYSLPPVKKQSDVRYAVKSNIVSAGKDSPPLTMDTIARSAAESVAPELWPAHAWVPALGCQGGMLLDVAGVNHGVCTSFWTHAGTNAYGATGGTVVAHDSKFESPTFTLAVSFTILGFVTGQVQLIQKSYTAASDPYYQFLISYNNASHVYSMWACINGTYTNINGGSLVLNKRNYIVLKYDGYVLNTYLNNVIICTTNKTGSATSFATPLGIQKTASGWTTGTGIGNDIVHSVSYWNRAILPTQIQQLSADPLLPFRRRKRTFYSLPSQPRTKTEYAIRKRVKESSDAPLTMDTIARGPGDSVAPELWPSHAWVPALGCQGGQIINLCRPKKFTIAGSSYVWGPLGLYNNTRTVFWDFIFPATWTFVVTATPMVSVLCSLEDSAYRMSADGYDELFGTLSFGGTVGGGRRRTVIIRRTDPQTIKAIMASKAGMEKKDVSSNTAIGNVGVFGRLWSNGSGIIENLYIYNTAIGDASTYDLIKDPLLPFRRNKSIIYTFEKKIWTGQPSTRLITGR